VKKKQKKENPEDHTKLIKIEGNNDPQETSNDKEEMLRNNMDISQEFDINAPYHSDNSSYYYENEESESENSSSSLEPSELNESSESNNSNVIQKYESLSQEVKSHKCF